MKVSKGLDLVRDYLRRGRYTFTRQEAAAALGVSDQAAYKTLQRLEADGWVFSPAVGLHVAVDPQHQAAGGLPIEWYIDDWAKHTGCQYYVGILSAAMLQGAGHQRPQRFQVVVDQVVRSGRLRARGVDLFWKQSIPAGAWEQRKSPAGYYRISTPEMTAYDLVAYRRACPSLDLAASVLAELGEALRPDKLAGLPKLGCQTAVLQRLGWLLDRTGWSEKTGPLAQALSVSRWPWRRLRSDRALAGKRDDRWRIVVNARIERELP